MTRTWRLLLAAALSVAVLLAVLAATVHALNVRGEAALDGAGAGAGSGSGSGSGPMPGAVPP